MTRSLLSIALIAALAACSAERTPADGAATTEPTVQTPAPEPVATPDTPAEQPGDMPATDQAGGGDNQARFDGYGDIKFGTAAADMEQAWGGELKEVGKEYNETCYFMSPTWTKVPAELSFMMGDGKFVRVSTESDRMVAPGGGKIGMTKAEIAALYTGIQEQPHKYTDGLYLEIKDPAGSNAMLIFATDGKGDTAKVTDWRVGMPPHVGYVEGCA